MGEYKEVISMAGSMANVILMPLPNPRVHKGESTSPHSMLCELQTCILSLWHPLHHGIGDDIDIIFRLNHRDG